MKIAIRFLLAFLVLLCGERVRGQNDNAALTGQQKLEAVNVVRLLNTAEMNYKTNAKKFGTIEDLISSATLSDTQNVTHYGPEKLNYSVPSHLLAGFSLRLTPSLDGSSYQLSLIDETWVEHWALFSNNNGLIFEGRPIL